MIKENYYILLDIKTIWYFMMWTLATVDGSIVTQYEDAVVFEGKKYIITRLD